MIIMREIWKIEVIMKWSESCHLLCTFGDQFVFQALDCAGASSVGVPTGAAGTARMSPAQTAVVGPL